MLLNIHFKVPLLMVGEIKLCKLCIIFLYIESFDFHCSMVKQNERVRKQQMAAPRS